MSSAGAVTRASPELIVVNPAELPKQLLRSFVEHLGKSDAHFDHEIAALPAPRRWRATLPDVKPLPRLRPRRHPEARRAIGRGHFDPGSKRRFVHADRHDDVKIVALAHKCLVRRHLDREIEVPGAPPPLSDIALLRHTDASAVADAGRNADRNRLAAHFHSETAATPAGCVLQSTCSSARVTAFRKHHAPAARAQETAALTTLASRLRDFQQAGPATRLARVAASQRHLPPRATHRLVEGQRHRCMKVGTARRFGPLRVLPLREHLREQIPERGRVGVGHAAREVEPLELERDRCRRGGERAGVVSQPPLGIAQRLVGSRDFLEASFRCLVARVDVGVILPSQPLVRPLDVNQRRAPRDSEKLV